MSLADAASAQDEAFMRLALQLASEAASAGEVPVGAVVVQGGVVVGSGRNSPLQSCDPSAHAEINALRMAASRLGNYRLDGCTIYVSLEPCAMCCGAMLHSRLGRVVFAAAEPKTGCAGSVLDLFANSRINHQTVVQGGLLAPESSLLLQEFFRIRRVQQQQQATPLREDALRTPARCFDGLASYPWPARYAGDLPCLGGLRMHYLDLGAAPGPTTFFLLHPIPGWSYSYRSLIAELVEQGARVVAPDLPGFGKSDKPKRESAHTWEWHVRCLLDLMDRLELRDAVLIAPDRTHPLAQGLVALAGARIRALEERPCAALGGVQEEDSGMRAPYPDAGHRAGERALAPKRK